ncbi:MAG: hypothetical protein J2P13_12980 [Acidobacteria bacterium]|nr:hypothetical protein [Acidobacteriota bacterium]
MNGTSSKVAGSLRRKARRDARRAASHLEPDGALINFGDGVIGLLRGAGCSEKDIDRFRRGKVSMAALLEDRPLTRAKPHRQTTP